MIIAAAQYRSIRGDIIANRQRHIDFAIQAAKYQVNLLIFPELSLTGYEPSIANTLACDYDDQQLCQLAEAAHQLDMVIAVGMPIRCREGVQIGQISFLPDGRRLLYTKAYLHSDEILYFIAGGNNQDVIHRKERIAYSICYELSVRQHVLNAEARGASMYLASVAKDQAGVTKAVTTLTGYAKQHGLVVMMTNEVGEQEDFTAAGQSSAWSSDGTLLVQMNDYQEGLLILDTESLEAEKYYF